MVNIEASSLKKTKALYEISRIAAELTGSACHGPTDADVAGLSATWAELGMIGSSTQKLTSAVQSCLGAGAATVGWR